MKNAHIRTDEDLERTSEAFEALESRIAQLEAEKAELVSLLWVIKLEGEVSNIITSFGISSLLQKYEK